MQPRKAPPNDPRCCQNCAYFCRHYVKLPDGSFVRCGVGHCTYPRIKPVRIDQVCDCFKPSTAD